MQATSSKIPFRSYYRSSSFKMALLFTALLATTGATLSVQAFSTQSTAMAWLAGLSLVCMAAVIVTSFLISVFVVTRTRQIAATAKEIMDTGDLSRRIHIDQSWDDLSYMADILNQLFDRIENLMHGVKTVSDNIAHDLRTPLTRLRNNLETLQKNATPENAHAYEALMGEADQLLATFAALLRISRIETGRQTSRFVDLRVDTLVRDVLDLYEPLIEEKGISLTITLEDTPYHGDRDLLFQAVANVVDNAVKFTPAGSTLQITLDAHNLSITDSGPGIPVHEHARIFERFYRTEASRNTPGNGLGLSLVAAVAQLHDIRVITASANPGLRVTLLFGNVNAIAA